MNRAKIISLSVLMLAAAAVAQLASGNSTRKITLPAMVETVIFTNVVEASNEFKCPHHGEASGWHESTHIMLNGHFCRYEPPTVRWTTSNLVKRVTLTAEWGGRTIKDTYETNLFSKTTTWKLNLNPEWKETINEQTSNLLWPNRR